MPLLLRRKSTLLRCFSQLSRHKINQAINQHRFAFAGCLVDLAYETFEEHHAESGALWWRDTVQFAVRWRMCRCFDDSKSPPLMSQVPSPALILKSGSIDLAEPRKTLPTCTISQVREAQRSEVDQALPDLIGL